ncbi:MAG: hypothetical protein JWM80_904 [Cyanobacteria bacterium RYN_339]|nr:hypothetical protein [Cyanobacteria bacterium RYN_339]
MDLEAFQAHCDTMPGAAAGYPFGPEVVVYKVGGKMFAIAATPPREPRMTLKCDPEWARVLRDTYPAVIPGYHTNKRHWNTVAWDGTIPDAELRGMIDHAYAQVVKGLTKAQRAAL